MSMHLATMAKSGIAVPVTLPSYLKAVLEGPVPRRNNVLYTHPMYMYRLSVLTPFLSTLCSHPISRCSAHPISRCSVLTPSLGTPCPPLC